MESPSLSASPLSSTEEPLTKTSPSPSVSSHGPTTGSRSTAASETPRLPGTTHAISSSFTNSSTSHFLPTSTEASSSAVPVVPCHNGGTPLGTRCLCKPLFTGPQCQEALNEVVVEITTTVNVVVKVTNRNYSPEMQNLSSSVSVEFMRAFKIQMDIFYFNIVHNFQGIKVIRLSNGSIVVDHDVLFSTPYSGFNTSYNATLDVVRNQLEGAECRRDSLCFSNISVHRVAPDLKAFSELCRNEELVPQAFQGYYVPQMVNGQLRCVSNCSTWHPHPFTCGHGSCYIQASGPSCYCEQSDTYWYVGSRCEQSISKVGVAVGVAVGLAALLLVILVLAVLLCWRRKEKDHRLMGTPDEEKWYENESEWNGGPRGSMGRNPEANSLPESESGAGSDQADSSEQGSFRPCLDKVDTSLQTRIARPQVTRL